MKELIINPDCRDCAYYAMLGKINKYWTKDICTKHNMSSKSVLKPLGKKTCQNFKYKNNTDYINASGDRQIIGIEAPNSTNKIKLNGVNK